jgi:lipopolysaccharide/colanic/teichoic acid biosynthesis glycosyltransferase
MTTSTFSHPLTLDSPPSGMASAEPKPVPTVKAREFSRVIKRVIDVAGALSGLVLLSLPMLIIAAIIRLESPGPVIFRQRRVGVGGQIFWFLKFRTMVADAETRLEDLEPLNESTCGVLFKIRNDPRITPLGRFLRRSSLDELPQLFNVLRGEMSLVGPRPLQLRDSDRLEMAQPEAFAQRLRVLPGMSGAWQVGGRSETDCFGMLQYDLDYVANWSVAGDLWIICRTFVAVLRGRGAY